MGILRWRHMGKITKAGYIFIGLVIIIFGVYLIYHQYSFEIKGATVQGTVVNISKQYYTSGNTQRYGDVSDIRFTAADGKEYTFKSPPGLLAKPFVGQTVTVVYDKVNPRSAMEKHVFVPWLCFIVLAFLGSGLIRVGLFANTPDFRPEWIATWFWRKKK